MCWRGMLYLTKIHGQTSRIYYIRARTSKHLIGLIFAHVRDQYAIPCRGRILVDRSQPLWLAGDTVTGGTFSLKHPKVLFPLPS